jgi:hypothetical protein
MAIAEMMTDAGPFSRPSIAAMTDAVLLSELHSFLGDSRQLLARLIRHLLEVQARELHRRRAYGNIVDFCTGELHLSQEDARLRASAVLVAKNFPVVIEMIERGETNLATLAILRRHLTKGNHLALLNEARGLSKRQVRKLVARPSFKPTIRGLAISTFARTNIPPNAAGSSRQVALPFQSSSSDAATSEQLSVSERPETNEHESEDSDVSIGDRPSRSSTSRTSLLQEPESPSPSEQDLGSSRFSWRVVVESKTQEKLERIARLLEFSSAAGALDRVLDHALDLVLSEIEEKEVVERVGEMDVEVEIVKEPRDGEEVVAPRMDHDSSARTDGAPSARKGGGSFSGRGGKARAVAGVRTSSRKRLAKSRHRGANCARAVDDGEINAAEILDSLSTKGSATEDSVLDQRPRLSLTMAPLLNEP